MTPRQFNFLVERHNQKTKREDRRAGEIIAILFNANRDPDKVDGIDWTDVFPEWKEEPPEQTEEEMFRTMLLFAKSTEGLSH